jgi:predicted secreted protein
VIDYILFYLPNHIDFDDNNIFIKTKEGIITVPYQQVTMLKLTGLSIGSKNIWKIKYYDNGREKVARFYPRNYSNTLGDFIKLLRSRNPNTQFISFSWSF